MTTFETSVEISLLKSYVSFPTTSTLSTFVVPQGSVLVQAVYLVLKQHQVYWNGRMFVVANAIIHVSRLFTGMYS